MANGQEAIKGLCQSLPWGSVFGRSRLTLELASHLLAPESFWQFLLHQALDIFQKLLLLENKSDEDFTTFVMKKGFRS